MKPVDSPWLRITYLLLAIIIFFLSGCEVVDQQQNTPMPDQPLPSPRVQSEVLPTAINQPKNTAVMPTELPDPVGESIFGTSIVPPGVPGGLEQVTQIGLKWSRIDLAWSLIEPQQGQIDWSQAADFEQQVRDDSQAGLNVIVILGATPLWAVKPGFSCGVIREDLVDSFALFARQAVSRYSPAPYNVKYWEVYNEPDAPGFLGCWGDVNDHDYFGGKTYGLMLSKVYPQIKAANPDAQVLVGGLLLDCDPVDPPDLPDKPGQKKDCTPGRFFEGVLNAGATNAFDGVAFHSYDYYLKYAEYSNPNWHSSRLGIGSSAIPKAAYLRDVMQKYGVKDRYLMDTEFAIFCGAAGAPYCNPFIKEVEATKAFYVVHMLTSAKAENFQAAIWYASIGDRNNSLINMDLTPKPVLYAFEVTNRLIGQAKYIQQISASNFWVYEFKQSNYKIWVVWTKDNQSHTLDLPAQPESAYIIGIDGQAHQSKIQKSIVLDVAPAFLVFVDQ